MLELALPYNCYEWGVFRYINLWNGVNFGCSPCAWSLLALKICYKSFHQYRFDRQSFFFFFFRNVPFFPLQHLGLCSRALAQPTHCRSESEPLAYWHRLRKVLQASNPHAATDARTPFRMLYQHVPRHHIVWARGSPGRTWRLPDKCVKGMRSSGTTRHADNVWAVIFMKLENI